MARPEDLGRGLFQLWAESFGSADARVRGYYATLGARPRNPEAIALELSTLEWAAADFAIFRVLGISGARVRVCAGRDASFLRLADHHGGKDVVALMKVLGTGMDRYAGHFRDLRQAKRSEWALALGHTFAHASGEDDLHTVMLGATQCAIAFKCYVGFLEDGLPSTRPWWKRALRTA